MLRQQKKDRRCNAITRAVLKPSHLRLPASFAGETLPNAGAPADAIDPSIALLCAM
jgi:hypothetical protein